MDENSIRGSSEADEPEQQKAETDHQAKPLPADAVREEALEERKPEEIDERMDENSNRSSSEAGDLPSDAVLAEQELEGSKPEEAVAEMAPISSAFEAQREEEETPAADTAPQALEALGAETARLRDEENVSEYTGSEGELSKATSSCEMQDTSLGEIAEKAEESIEPAKQKAEESEEPAKEQVESREAEKAIENGTATEKAQEMEDAPDGPPEEAMDSGAIEKEMEDAPEREIDDKGTPSRSEEVAEFDTFGGAWRGESLSPQHRTSSRVWHVMRMQPLPPPDPEDNWEMSSCGDGEMDEEEHELMLEKLRVDKKVPRWCENYLELVHQQHDWDPDSIFGQVPTCDLEEVLPDSIYEELGEKRNYLSKRRKSEGDWSRDRLTDDNVEDYKMKLGHTKAWIADVDALSPTQRAMIEGFGGVSRSRGSRDTAASPRNNASDIQ